ncbi:MAG TPA: NADP-dependent oxidoreductase [Jatrophihabitans sp.]|nr:NADP-dependent oxidoreductase [Jatrophihabitans sp.]
MSKVVVATAFGGPEVLSVVDRPSPEPAAGEARVAVRAAAVNPIDYKLYSGAWGRDPNVLPRRLGAEAAGVVTAVGEGARGPAGDLAVGDEVIVYPASGGYAQEIVAPGDALVPKPAGMPWAQAAGLLLTGVTAVHALETVQLEAGETVLIHGGAGGVGLMAVQLAALRGATVLATASPRNHDLLHGFGAVPISYGPGLADRVRQAAPGGVAAALDLVGTDEAVDVSLELVADRNRIVTIAAFGRFQEAGIRAIGGGTGADPGTELRAAARLQLTELWAQGKLRVVVDRTYPLDEVADAHREIKAGHATGKIVLVP